MIERQNRNLRALLALSVLVFGLSSLRAAENAAAVEARLSADVKFLASEPCEGRGVTTKGINLAADHIAQEFKKAGLKPAGADGTYFQPFTMGTGGKLGADNRLVLKGPQGQEIALEMGKQFTVMGFGGTGKVSAPIVFAGHGITSDDPKYDDFAGLDVAGKIVVILRQVPRQGDHPAGVFKVEGGLSPHANLDRKAVNAAAHKAAAVIIVSDNLTVAEDNDALRDFNSTAQRGLQSVDIPVVHMKRGYGNVMIRSVLDTDLSQIEKTIDRDLKPQGAALTGWTAEVQTTVTRGVATVKNVIGTLEGAGPLAKETIVIGAHYDHLGYGQLGSLLGRAGQKQIHFGADDNASGTASLIELARRFGAIEKRQGRRLVFIAFTAEELGLIGASHYCNKQPIFPLDSTVAMINMDMVGRLRDDKLIVFGTGTSKELPPMIEKLAEKHKFKLTQKTLLGEGGGSSDHEVFYRKNIPVAHFFTGVHPQYHKPTDQADLINVEGIRRVTDLIEELMLDLSTTERRPQFVKLTGSGHAGLPIGRGNAPRLGIVPDYSDEGEGVLLSGVSEGAPAEKAGLKAGDRIVEISGKPIKSIQGYMAVMAGHKKGDTIDVKVMRQGKAETFKAELK